MKYQNTKTGFIFDSDSECKGEDWVLLNPTPAPVKEEKEPTPKRSKNGSNSNDK